MGTDRAPPTARPACALARRIEPLNTLNLAPSVDGGASSHVRYKYCCRSPARKRLLRSDQVPRWPSILRSAKAVPSGVWKSRVALAAMSSTSVLITAFGRWPQCRALLLLMRRPMGRGDGDGNWLAEMREPSRRARTRGHKHLKKLDSLTINLQELQRLIASTYKYYSAAASADGAPSDFAFEYVSTAQP